MSLSPFLVKICRIWASVILIKIILIKRKVCSYSKPHPLPHSRGVFHISDDGNVNPSGRLVGSGVLILEKSALYLCLRKWGPFSYKKMTYLYQKMDPFILPKNIYLCINAINGTLEITKIRYLFAKMGPLELQKLIVFIQQWTPILQK